MHFQVFIPHAKHSPNELIDVGLQHLRAGAIPDAVERGPNGEPGYTFSWMTGRGAVHKGYDLNLQDWVPAIANDDEFPAGRYWVGFHKTKPPTPLELERSVPYGGEFVMFGDGQEWRLPKAERLPRTMIRTDDGSDEFHIDQKFHRFVLEATEWSRFLRSAVPGGECSYSLLRDFVERALLINYRLTPEVSDRLRLFSSGDHGTILKAVFTITRPDVTEPVRNG